MTTTARTALVVEDDEIIRRVLSTWLTDDGWSVESAPSADEGLEIAIHLRPKLAVCDVRLPGAHDGMWLSASLLACSPRTRVIFATGIDNLPGGATLRANVAGYVIKPFRRRDLLAVAADISFGPDACDWPDDMSAEIARRRRELIADIRAAVSTMPADDEALALALLAGETREHLRTLTALTEGVCERMDIDVAARPHLVRAVIFANLGRRVYPDTAADSRMRFDVPLETRWALTLLGMPEAGEMSGWLSVVEPALGHENRRRSGRAAQVLHGLVTWRQLADADSTCANRRVKLTDALMRLRSGATGVDPGVRAAIEVVARKTIGATRARDLETTPA